MGLLDQGQQAAEPSPTAGAMPTPAPTAGAAPAPAAAPDAAMGQAPTAQKSPAAPDMEGEEATPEEQAEYERVMVALAKVLYENEKTSNAVVDQIVPEDKIGSTAKTVMLFIQQFDKKVQMDEIVAAQMTQEATFRIMELAEARHNISYNEQEAKAILGASWEGVQQMFGADPEGHDAFVKSIGSDQLPQLKEQYEAALNG